MLPTGNPAATRGFTLLEILVVLAIVSFFLVIGVPTFIRGKDAADLKSQSRSLQAILISSRLRAVRGQAATAVTIDVENRSVLSGAGGNLFELPEDVDLIFRTAKEELVSDSASRIRFFADGSSTGGRITLAREGAAYHISVDWLTGRVAITE